VISQEEFYELWELWFGLEDSERITELLRSLNRKYIMGLVEP